MGCRQKSNQLRLIITEGSHLCKSWYIVDGIWTFAEPKLTPLNKVFRQRELHHGFIDVSTSWTSSEGLMVYMQVKAVYYFLKKNHLITSEWCSKLPTSSRFNLIMWSTWNLLLFCGWARSQAGIEMFLNRDNNSR